MEVKITVKTEDESFELNGDAIMGVISSNNSNTPGEDKTITIFTYGDINLNEQGNMIEALDTLSQKRKEHFIARAEALLKMDGEDNE